MLRVLDAKFVTTAVSPDGYPKGSWPEVAFAGRSNVGKSSMINALVARHGLVRVSKTPGRTRALNFFEASLTDGERQYDVRLCDLPGYGFAKVSKVERDKWRTMIAGYLADRRTLKVVVNIVDAEVGPSAADEESLGYLSEGKARILLVATKIDRLPKAKRKPRLVEIAKTLELPLEAVVGFSATEKLGIEEAWDRILSGMFDYKVPR